MATTSAQESAYITALLRSLEFQGVQFLRYVTVDVCNNIRCKARPIGHLLSAKTKDELLTLDNQVSVAAVCYAGLPYYADYMIDGTGMDARNVLILRPDLKSFRNLPYAPKTAMVMANLKDQYTHEPSPLCTRTLLQKVLDVAAEKYNVGFNVGVELEFCLVNLETDKFVDASVFANTTTLNEQEDFLSDLYQQLQQQYVDIELIHSESGPGQLEVVLKYCNDAIEMADNVIITRETIKAVARKHHCKALFLPKYDLMKAGNGMHVHISTRNAVVSKDNNNNNDKVDRSFCNGNSLTKTGSAFVEGILQHLPALVGLTLPTVNSFRRVGPGCWTGSVVGWNVEDKECGIRICSNLATKDWDHVEYKLCDGTCNLYLALAAILSAGLEGIEKELSLRPPLGMEEGSSSSTEGGGSSKVEPLPSSVTEAFNALEKDEMIMNLLGGGGGDAKNGLVKGYLALRRNEAERANQNMTLEDEVKEALSRS